MPTPLDRPPAWVKDAVFYQIFPDRFAQSVDKPGQFEPWEAPPTHHGYKGGDLRGVIHHLDYLADLGITAIYFNPIFASASNHRYHAWDYYRIDPMLGDDDTFDDLIAECHARNIKVVLDGVFNHTGRGFFQFSDILEAGAHSPYVDWYNIYDFPVRAFTGEVPNYDAWWGMPALPKLNTDNPDVREYLMQVAEHWLTRGIDGWRLDVPQEITTDGFWEEFRTRVRAVNPDAYIVGEVWDDATDWISAGTRFDGTMNYLFAGYALAFAAGDRIPPHLLKDLGFPLRPALDGSGFAHQIESLLKLYPPDATLANLNLLDSHDIPRVLSLCDDDFTALELAVVLQMTFPGAPSVYYGSEIGMTGGKDPDNRKGFVWDETTWNTKVHDLYKSLIAIRHEHAALRSGDYRVVHSEDNLVLIERRDDQSRVLIALNAGTEAVATTVKHVAASGFTTIWGEGGLASDETGLRLAMAPRSVAIWDADA